jgi:preprotein translocase subunit SecE
MGDEGTLGKGGWQRAVDYFNDVRTEMKRVTWPSKQEVYGTTVMVIITTFLFAGYFAICDWIFSSSITRLLAWLERHV